MATGSFKKHGNMWRITIEAGRDSENKRKRIIRHVQGNREAAQQEMMRLLQELGSGLVIDAGGLTVGDYLTQWLTGRKQNLAPRTYSSYKQHINGHLIPSLGQISLAKLHPVQIDVFKNGKLEEGLSVNTVKKILTTLRQALKRAVQLRLLNHNPLDAVEAPKPEPASFRVLEMPELRKLLKAAEGTIIHALVFLAAYTGMRRGELLGLTWENVNLDEGTIRIAQQWQLAGDKGMELRKPKSKAGIRTIAIPASAVEFMRAMDRTGTYVFQSPQTRMPYHPSHVNDQFRAIAAAAGFEGLRLHDLRHTHASQLISAGEVLTEVQERLGHTLPSTTANIYTHSLPSRKRNVADKFEELMKNPDQ